MYFGYNLLLLQESTDGKICERNRDKFETLHSSKKDTFQWNRCHKTDACTLFENCSKCRIFNLDFWHFPPIFVQSKLTYLVTQFDRKLQIFNRGLEFLINFAFDRKCYVHETFLWFSNTVFHSLKWIIYTRNWYFRGLMRQLKQHSTLFENHPKCRIWILWF